MIKAGTASLARLGAKSDANCVTSTPNQLLSSGLTSKACNSGCSCCVNLKEARRAIKRARANQQQTTDANRAALKKLEHLKTKMKEHTENNSRMISNLLQQLKQKEQPLTNDEANQQLAAKDAEMKQQLGVKEQQLAANEAEMNQQLALKEQQLAANAAKIVQLLAEMDVLRQAQEQDRDNAKKASNEKAADEKEAEAASVALANVSRLQALSSVSADSILDP
jgi:hypothetical protein